MKLQLEIVWLSRPTGARFSIFADEQEIVGKQTIENSYIDASVGARMRLRLPHNDVEHLPRNWYPI